MGLEVPLPGYGSKDVLTGLCVVFRAPLLALHPCVAQSLRRSGSILIRNANPLPWYDAWGRIAHDTRRHCEEEKYEKKEIERTGF